MHFEAPDYNNEQPSHEPADCDTTITDRLSPMDADNAEPLDAYVASDLLPTDEAETTEAFILPARRGITYEQLHFVDGKPMRGPHPEHDLHQYIERRKQDRAHAETVLDTILEDPAYRDDSNQELYALVGAQLSADFGSSVGGEPVTLVTPDGRDKIRSELNLQKKSTAANILGRMVVYKNFDDEYHNALVALHEGAHFSALDRRELAVLRPLEQNEEAPYEFERELGLKAQILELGGFTAYRPHISRKEAVGTLWEEGFSSSYALRGLENLGLTAQLDGLPGEIMQNKGGGLCFISNDADAYFNSVERRIFLPLKYSRSTTSQLSGHRLTMTHPSFIVAYAIDLLDAQLPGLYDEMVQSRSDPGARKYVRERINAVRPGVRLYDRVASGRNNQADASIALLQVMRCLGLPDEAAK